MPKEPNVEFKVGLFVLAALIGFTVFVWSITDTSVFEKGKTFRVVFNFANGLKQSAPVRVAGVDEGIVKDITLFFDRKDSSIKARVLVWIDEATLIPEDSVVTINQLGLLGEKYIEIIPGINKEHFFEEGQTIVGKDPVSQEEISERIIEVADRLEDSIAGFNRLLNDEGNVESVGATLKNLSLVTGSLQGLLLDIREGKGTIGKLMYDDRIYDNLEGMTSDLKENPWKLLYRAKEVSPRKRISVENVQ